MNYIIFEDNNCHLLRPFTDLHASFDLRVGILTNIDRVKYLISENDTIQLYVRSDIKKIVEEKYPNYVVNPEIYKPGVFLNGNCLWNSDSIEAIKGDYSYSNENGLVAFSSDTNINFHDIEKLIQDKSLVSSKISVESIKYLWDSFDFLDNMIQFDSEFLYKYKKGDLHPSVTLLNQDNIIINEGCNIGAGAVLDASEGPIILDEYSYVDIGALIKGPTYIGKYSKINPGAKIRGPVSIGPYCKIGGEVEDSIIQGFSNKQHDGFLGHSYIGEWVNLGANTNTSDLKNNYGKIKVKISHDDIIDTNKMFVGSIIGDFTKTAISTRLNSGTFIGTGSNVFDNSFIEKFIPSFSWGKENKVGLNRFLDSCFKMMNRRDVDMSVCLKERLIQLYQKIEI